MKHFNIEFLLDSEASVWVAQSEDLVGLVTEATSIDALLAKLKELIPALLEANA